MTVTTVKSGSSRNARASRSTRTATSKRSEKVKGHLTTTALAGLTIALLGAIAILQLTVHDPDHVLLTAVASWGLLSLPVGLLVGHCALGSGSGAGEED